MLRRGNSGGISAIEMRLFRSVVLVSVFGADMDGATADEGGGGCRLAVDDTPHPIRSQNSSEWYSNRLESVSTDIAIPPSDQA